MRFSSTHVYRRAAGISLLVLLLFIALFPTKLVPPAEAATLNVPSASYPTIQSAIDAAKSRDVIQVAAGVYQEHLIIPVSKLKIIGANKATAIIDAGGTGTPITLENGEVTITGFTIRNGGLNVGISTYTFGTHNISGNIIENNSIGIYFSESSNTIVSKNTFLNNSMHAINIAGSLSNQISYNNISGSAYGINLTKTNSTTVTRNEISGTSYGIYVSTATLDTISYNKEQSSSCSIQAAYSDHITINHNTLSGGMYGILLHTTTTSQLANNTITDASYGLYLAYSNQNTIGGTRDNLIARNDWGLYLYASAGNQITNGNAIGGNTWGIYITANSDGNVIHHNNFVSNVRQAVQSLDSANTWDDGAQGNYWSDYTGYPPAGGVDYNPLSAPWPLRNIAITSVTPSKTQFYPGEAVTVSVDVKNFGVITESVKVTAYYGSNIIGTKTTTLAQSAAQLLPFNWDTGSVQVGNYAISATVEPIPYVERNYTDNTLIDGTVQVGLLGDINNDHTVNQQDLTLLKQAYGSKPGDPNWNQNADFNYDNIIDGEDLHLLGENYGKTA